MNREFHLGDVLSITTGRLVSPRHVDGIYDILNFMTGESLYTHQLGRAMQACRPSLLNQHPALAEVDVSDVGVNNWRPWLLTQTARFGEVLAVEPLLPGVYAAMDPIDELRTMVPDEKIIVVKTGAA